MVSAQAGNWRPGNQRSQTPQPGAENNRITPRQFQFNQNPGLNHGQNRIQQITTEQVTITGELTIAQGMIAVKAGDITYLTMGLTRYVNFIDNLKAGATVTIEGVAVTGRQDDTKYLQISKLTIGGKEYDLQIPWANFFNQAQTRPEAPNPPEARPNPPETPNPPGVHPAPRAPNPPSVRPGAQPPSPPAVRPQPPSPQPSAPVPPGRNR